MELRRRQVYRAAVAYAGAAFVLWQASAIVIRALGWPGWILTVMVVGAAIGFPVVVGLAWVYEVSPEGIRRTPSDEEGAGSEAAPAASRTTRAGGLVVAVVAAGALGWWLWPHETLAFSEGDAIVLAEFRNTTDDEVFTESLDTALRTSLQQSPYLRVYPKSKVEDALVRMELDADTVRVTGSRAREIARREGVPVAVVPRVAAVGGDYRIGAAVYPAGGEEAVATEVVRAESRDEVLDALDELAVWIRKRVGEAQESVQRHHRPLQAVTTSSLEALKVFSRGQEHYLDGEWKEARRLFRHALEIDSAFTGARAQLGELEYQHFDREEGIRLLRRAVENRESLTEFESLMIQGFFAENVEEDLEEAAGFYRTLTNLYPNRSEPRHNLGWALARMGRSKEAAERYREALARGAGNLTRYGLNSVYLYSLGRVDSALATSHRWIAEDSTSARAWNHLGWAYLGADSVEAAEAAFRRAVALDSTFVTARYRLGHSQRLAGRYGEAAETFQRILTVDSLQYGAHYNAGVAREMAGRDSAARARYRDYVGMVERVVEANPEWAYNYVNLARGLARLGRDGRAEEARKEGVARSDGSAGFTFGLALLAGARGRGDRSVELLRRAIDAGYTNFVWVKVHPDLAGLSRRRDFRVMLDSLIHGPAE